jgi:hypothetical protein
MGRSTLPHVEKNERAWEPETIPGTLGTFLGTRDFIAVRGRRRTG